MNLIINLDKPKGISSQQAVIQARKTVGAKKAGHAGTLDPVATGILLVCLGEATKITGFLSGLDKEYIAVMKLGEKTDTLDTEGTIILTVKDFSLERKEIEDVIERFKGSILQSPPMYSAIKIKGQPLYKLARQGIVVDRPQRKVNIHRIEIMEFTSPMLTIKVSCSKGTYIRTLCDDIGDALDVGAHIVALRRTGIGDIRIEDSITMDELKRSTELKNSENSNPNPQLTGERHGNNKAFLSIDAALGHLREVILTDTEFRQARNGIAFLHPDISGLSEHLRLKTPEKELFAIGRLAEKKIKVERMFRFDFIKALF